MWKLHKQGAAQSAPLSGKTTKARGDAAEDQALAHLQRKGLELVSRNFRTPGRGGGEVDLIMREADGTLVFVEVRQRAGLAHGGAGGSITVHKQKRIVLAARHFLWQLGSEPACRFDVVLIGRDSEQVPQWIQGAFEAPATF
ncbi:YraN family protein [Hydrogenophaga sp. 5NK40-0174]|uniref:YraN family protein n=1 Tax=Hydrogenophaga sp. 5NK40-0174 TaxID=3127649 RepID=UPI003109EC63